MGENPTEKELRDMTSEVDQDGSGEIEFNEFLMLMARKMMEVDIHMEIKQGFKAFDRDSDGVISAVDLYQMLNNIGTKISLEEAT